MFAELQNQEARTMTQPHRVFSFFAGSGLLDLAFEDSGFDIAFVNEFFASFAEAYTHSRAALGKASPSQGLHVCSIDDFLEDRSDEFLEKYMAVKEGAASVGFIGGPPCPDFSIGGKNRGHLGENGRLTRSYFELILAAKPDWFLFENVKGLWRTKKHRQFFDEMKEMVSEDYHLSERLFNSIEAGAPQDRDRIIVFGVRKKLASGAEMDWEKDLPYPGRSAFEKYNWVDRSPFAEDGSLVKPNNVPIELTVQYWFDKNEVDNHVNAVDCFKPRAGLAKFQTIEEGDDSRKSSKRLHRWRYSPTAAYGNNEVHLHPYKARRINVAEALAIQSMPKEFELPTHMSLSNKFKTIGNGVPYLLGMHIASVINDFLTENFAEEVS